MTLVQTKNRDEMVVQILLAAIMMVEMVIRAVLMSNEHSVKTNAWVALRDPLFLLLYCLWLRHFFVDDGRSPTRPARASHSIDQFS